MYLTQSNYCCSDDLISALQASYVALLCLTLELFNTAFTAVTIRCRELVLVHAVTAAGAAIRQNRLRKNLNN